MNWFRMYSEARNDAKLRSLSDSQHRVWFNLLCFANEQKDERGSIAGYEEELLAVEVAGGDIELLRETLDRLQRLRIIVVEDNTITFINFAKRNYDKPSDSPEATRERKRRQRDKEKEDNNVTPMSRDVTTHTQTNRLTDRLTDPETDTERDLSLTTGQCPEAADRPSGKVLIAELTEAYRAVEGIKPTNGDHAFIGALYNEHSYEQVLSAINKLQMASAVQELKKPLIYLKGILQNKERDGGGGQVRAPDQESARAKKKKEIIRSLYV